MVHTLPDYTTKYRMAKIFGQIDSGELAARLQSPDKYDRRGNVAFMDNFEGGVLQWETGGGGTSPVSALTTANARDGSQSCMLTAGAGVLGQAYIYKYLGLINPGRIGLETSFTLNPNTVYFTVAFWYYDGARVHRGSMTYDLPNKKWFYLNSLGGDTDLLLNVTLRTANSPWHTCKLVLDTDTDEYVRFLYNNVETPMPGIGIYADTDLEEAMVYMGITHFSTHANVQSIYVDNVILTQNEL